MSKLQLTEVFSLNALLLSIFGAWPTVKFRTCHKIYSTIYLFLTVFILLVILTVNLIFARSVDTVIRDGVIYVSQVVCIAKVIMILIKRDDILEALKLLDSALFMDDDFGKRRIENTVSIYKKCHKFYIVLCNIVFSLQGVLPLILHGIMKRRVKLPFAELTFLSDEVRDNYFMFFYTYLTVAPYGTMMYEVNIDAIMFGLMFIAISHLKVINNRLINFTTAKIKSKDEMQKLVAILKHYDIVLRFCESLQKILSVTMFIQFCTSAALICVIMCGLLLPSTTESRIFMMTYLEVMIGQVFMPGWLGTQLEFESQELVSAAYNADWIPRSERFKRSLRLFVERANTPIVLTGMKMFPLSLGTFLMIMKMAYSLFTVVRHIQDR